MSYNSPRDKHIPVKTVQVHPRVLKEDHACCDCIHFIPTNAIAEKNGLCRENNHYVCNYDECTAFTKKQGE